jgi:hypothetical protein
MDFSRSLNKKLKLNFFSSSSLSWLVGADAANHCGVLCETPRETSSTTAATTATAATATTAATTTATATAMAAAASGPTKTPGILSAARGLISTPDHEEGEEEKKGEEEKEEKEKRGMAEATVGSPTTRRGCSEAVKRS